MKVMGIMLAAGEAQRFGSDKRQALLPDGQCLLQCSLQQLYPCVDGIVLVVKQSAPWLEALLQAFPRVELLQVPTSKGLGDSLAAAIQCINGVDVEAKGEAKGMDKSPTDAVLLALGDMPWIKPYTYQHLRTALAHHAIVAPTYQGKRGHPVGFQRNYFNALSRCKGERGAYSLLANAGVDLHCCTLEDPGVLADIDRPEDINGNG